MDKQTVAYAYIDNKLTKHEKMWANLKCILLRERNKYEKATYFVIPIT